MPATPNPYEVLRIAVLVSNDEIVTRGTSLIVAESSEEQKRKYRSAVEALTTHPLEKAHHKFWEPAGAAYRDTAEEAFVSRYGTGPLDREVLNQRVRVFLDQDCGGERLLDAMIPRPQPPGKIEDCHPTGTPQTPLNVPFDPGDLFR